jgi:hypothetical protein
VRKTRAPEVRNFLAKIKGKLAHKGAGNEQVVSILEKQHPEAIKAELADIVHIGLMKLASESCTHRSGVESRSQLEMFAEYATPKMVYLRVVDSKGHVSKKQFAVGSLTPALVRQCVAENTRTQRPKLSPQMKELTRLADDMEPFAETAASTIDECWERKTA